MTESLSQTRIDALQHRYDETPYHDQNYPLFELDRLLGLSALFDLVSPRTVARGARVLDLGCASGLHVREQAQRYPDASFTGVDFSPVEIEHGRKAASEAGLDNVELIQADLRTFEVEPESYDIVLNHGVFSWVADDVKERILMLSRQALAPHGVAAIAYLTYPGWKQREALRELLSMRSHSDTPTETRLEESTNLLRFLDTAYASRTNDPHAASLLAATRSMRSTPQNAFVHDELGPVHDPCYFMQFVEWAQECGLSFLAEADLGTMSIDGLAPGAARELDLLAPDAIETQQLIDFVVNRSGRASLLVRSDASPDRQVGADRLAALRYSSRWWKVTPLNAPADAPDRFESPDGQSLETSDPAVQHVLALLCSDREKTFSLDDMAPHQATPSPETGEIRQALPPVEPDDVRTAVAGLVARGVIEPRTVAVDGA